MDNKGFYEHDLKINLETQIDLYEQDRHRYWNEALGEGEYTSLNIAYEQAERFAKAILSGVESLISCEEMEADLDRLDQEMRRIANFPGYKRE